MNVQPGASGTKAGTIGGTLLSVALTIDGSDFMRTAVLAAVGAIVSFSVSVFLKWMIRAIGRKGFGSKT